jgi:hypothetical protein
VIGTFFGCFPKALAWSGIGALLFQLVRLSGHNIELIRVVGAAIVKIPQQLPSPLPFTSGFLLQSS